MKTEFSHFIRPILILLILMMLIMLGARIGKHLNNPSIYESNIKKTAYSENDFDYDALTHPQVQWQISVTKYAALRISVKETAKEFPDFKEVYDKYCKDKKDQSLLNSEPYEIKLRSGNNIIGNITGIYPTWITVCAQNQALLSFKKEELDPEFLELQSPDKYLEKIRTELPAYYRNSKNALTILDKINDSVITFELEKNGFGWSEKSQKWRPLKSYNWSARK